MRFENVGVDGYLILAGCLYAFLMGICFYMDWQNKRKHYKNKNKKNRNKFKGENK